MSYSTYYLQNAWKLNGFTERVEKPTSVNSLAFLCSNSWYLDLRGLKFSLEDMRLEQENNYYYSLSHSPVWSILKDNSNNSETICSVITHAIYANRTLHLVVSCSHSDISSNVNSKEGISYRELDALQYGEFTGYNLTGTFQSFLDDTSYTSSEIFLEKVERTQNLLRLHLFVDINTLEQTYRLGFFN